MQGYLEKRAKEIYKAIETFLRLRGVFDEIDTFELSILSHHFAMYEEAAQKINKKGFTQTAKNSNYTQVTGEFTVLRQCTDIISKYSSKFGLTPEAREKIKAFARGEEEESSFLDDL